MQGDWCKSSLECWAHKIVEWVMRTCHAGTSIYIYRGISQRNKPGSALFSHKCKKLAMNPHVKNDIQPSEHSVHGSKGTTYTARETDGMTWNRLNTIYNESGCTEYNYGPTTKVGPLWVGQLRKRRTFIARMADRPARQHQVQHECIENTEQNTLSESFTFLSLYAQVPRKREYARPDK